MNRQKSTQTVYRTTPAMADGETWFRQTVTFV
jgi:hypothetical protein